jgi:hypothetical protein
VPPRLLLDVVESTFPAPDGRAYTSPTNVGIARVGVEVDDLDRTYDIIAGRAEGCFETPPTTWELGPAFGQRRVAVLRSPDAVPFDLVERAP